MSFLGSIWLIIVYRSIQTTMQVSDCLLCLNLSVLLATSNPIQYWTNNIHGFQLKFVIDKLKMTNLWPIYLNNLVQHYNSNRNPSSNNKLLLIQHKCYGRRAFENSAPMLWNNLPHKLRKAKSLTIFKKQLKTLFDSYYC